MQNGSILIGHTVYRGGERSIIPQQLQKKLIFVKERGQNLETSCPHKKMLTSMKLTILRILSDMKNKQTSLAQPKVLYIGAADCYLT